MRIQFIGMGYEVQGFFSAGMINNWPTQVDFSGRRLKPGLVVSHYRRIQRKTLQSEAAQWLAAGTLA